MFYNIFAPSDGQNIMFLRGRLEYDAQGSVCEGSGAQALDRMRFSMDRGGGERPRSEKHRFDTPCTTFGVFCWSETPYFIVNLELPMAKTPCF